MSSRRAPDAGSSKPGRLEKAGELVRQRALTGTEASTIGFVLVGYIGAFALLGYGLDSYFKTSWIVAVGVLLGAIVGFREMFRMAQKLGGESIEDDAEKAREQLARGAQVKATSEPKNNAAPKVASTGGEIMQGEAMQGKTMPNDESPKPRYFSIPPPPTASFEKLDDTKSGTQNPRENSDDSLP
jgi:F0F1-type ATP synthase assembly protein I